MDRIINKDNKIKIKYPLRHAYVIAHFMLPFIPIKMLYTDWRHVKVLNYLVNNDEKLYKIELTTERIRGVHHIVFSTTQEKYKFPITYALTPFKISTILQCTYAFLSRQNYVVLDPYEFIEFAKDKKNEVLDRGISIWLEHRIKDVNRHHVRVRRGPNEYLEIINGLNEYCERSDIKNTVGFFIDKKDCLFKNPKNKFSDFIKNASFINSDKKMIVKKVNEWGDIVDDCETYEVIPFKRKSHYEILPEELLSFMNLCNYSTHEDYQSYVSMCVLKNKDMFLINNNDLEFVKRNGRWYNISYTYFKYIMKNTFEYLTDKFIRYIYYMLIRAGIENKEFTLQILYPEELKSLKRDILNHYPKEYMEVEEEYSNERLNTLEYEKVYSYITSKEIITISDQGHFICTMKYDDIEKLGFDKRLISKFSDYGLVIRVGKDYSIEIYDRHNFVYSTR